MQADPLPCAKDACRDSGLRDGLSGEGDGVHGLCRDVEEIELAAGLEGCVHRLVGVVLEYEDLAAVGVGEGDDLLEWATADGDATRAGKNAGGEVLHRVELGVVADLFRAAIDGEQAVLAPAPGAGL